MTENATPEGSAPETTTTTVPDLIAFEEARTAARAERQAEADAAAAQGPKVAAKATADRERDAYLKATEPTRQAPNYVERHAAYDTTALRFIEGTISDSTAAAKAAAKALGHSGGHIETRPV